MWRFFWGFFWTVLGFGLGGTEKGGEGKEKERKGGLGEGKSKKKGELNEQYQPKSPVDPSPISGPVRSRRARPIAGGPRG